jgi:alanine-glyoxylate transaminase/serine-glyoxylate transaminase/serine-pyruvate transaminase
MNAVFCPEGVDEAAVRKRLLDEFGLEIGAALGPLKGKIWRFGLMGYSCRPDNVMLCLTALSSVLSDMGLAGARGRCRSRGARRVCADAREGRAAEKTRGLMP